MQLAWLIRPGGENIERLIDELRAEARAGMSIGEAVRLHAPPGDITGSYLGRVFDAAGVPDAQPTGFLTPPTVAFDWPLSKAIDAAEAKFAAAHPLPRAV